MGEGTFVKSHFVNSSLHGVHQVNAEFTKWKSSSRSESWVHEVKDEFTRWKQVHEVKLGSRSEFSRRSVHEGTCTLFLLLSFLRVELLNIHAWESHRKNDKHDKYTDDSD